MLLILSGNDQVEYALNVWNVDSSQPNTRVNASHKAIAGRFTNVRISDRSLDSNKTYLGSVSFFNEEDKLIGKTIVEVKP
jgi:hypothetical protein